MRPHGRATVSAKDPHAFAICDGCGHLFNHVKLQFQYQYAGVGLIRINHLVCRKCKDTPNAQLKEIKNPGDPTAVRNPRPQDYNLSNSNRVISAPTVIDAKTGIPIPGSTERLTEDGGTRMLPQLGGSPYQSNPQPGITESLITPIIDGISYGRILSVLSIVSDGTNGALINVTCSVAHGLTTNDQIYVAGTVNNTGDGAYSVTVTSAMTFTYWLVTATTFNNSLLNGPTVIKTILVGLPRNNLLITPVRSR